MNRWHHIHFAKLCAALASGRWNWAPVTRYGKKALCVLGRRGRRYEFKLTGGAWVRPAPEPKKEGAK